MGRFHQVTGPDPGQTQQRSGQNCKETKAAIEEKRHAHVATSHKAMNNAGVETTVTNTSNYYIVYTALWNQNFPGPTPMMAYLSHLVSLAMATMCNFKENNVRLQRQHTLWPGDLQVSTLKNPFS